MDGKILLSLFPKNLWYDKFILEIKKFGFWAMGVFWLEGNHNLFELVSSWELTVDRYLGRENLWFASTGNQQNPDLEKSTHNISTNLHYILINSPDISTLKPKASIFICVTFPGIDKYNLSRVKSLFRTQISFI